MVIKRIEDIEREQSERKREKFKTDITKDIGDVFEGVFKKKEEPFSMFRFIIRTGIFLLGLLIAVNVVLGNVWLLKFLIKELFLS